MLRELQPYIKDIMLIVRKKKLDNKWTDRAYCSHFKDANLTEEQREFIEILSETSAISMLIENIEENMHTDYFRYKAMIEKKSNTLEEQLVVYISSSNSVVLSRAARLAEAASREKSPIRYKPSKDQDEILNKQKIDWINEIFKMENKLKRSFTRNRTSFEHANATNIFNTQKENDIEIITTETIIDPLVIVKSSKEMLINWGKSKKETFFYGAKGILSFFQDLFCIGDVQKTPLRLIDDIKPLLERLRGKITKPQIKTVINNTEYHTKDDTSLFESTFIGKRKEGRMSGLVEALVEPQSILKLSIGSKCESHFMSFSSHTCCQFFLFCAFYYNRYQEQPQEIIKVIGVVSLVLP